MTSLVSHPPGGTSDGMSTTSDSVDGSGDGEMDLTVVLPDGSYKEFTVEASKPMMDVLILVAAKCRLSPASYTLQTPQHPLTYKPSSSLHSLGVTTLHLLPKKTVQEKPAGKNAKPFEVTRRITVNLPRDQKHVMRVKPDIVLSSLFTMVCAEKSLDPVRYELVHPSHTDVPLNMTSLLSDYQLNELTLHTVCDTPPSSSSTMPKLSRGSVKDRPPHDQEDSAYMPGMAEKKKKGLFSMFSRKKSSKMNVTSQKSAQGGMPPNRMSMAVPSHERTQPPQRPQSEYSSHSTYDDTASSHTPEGSTTPQKPPRKKRQAPLPPPTQPSTSQADLEPIRSRNSSVSSSQTATCNNASDRTEHELAPPSNDDTTTLGRKKRKAPLPPAAVSTTKTESAVSSSPDTVSPATETEPSSTPTVDAVSPRKPESPSSDVITKSSVDVIAKSPSKSVTSESGITKSSPPVIVESSPTEVQTSSDLSKSIDSVPPQSNGRLATEDILPTPPSSPENAHDKITPHTTEPHSEEKLPADVIEELTNAQVEVRPPCKFVAPPPPVTPPPPEISTPVGGPVPVMGRGWEEEASPVQMSEHSTQVHVSYRNSLSSAPNSFVQSPQVGPQKLCGQLETAFAHVNADDSPVLHDVQSFPADKSIDSGMHLSSGLDMMDDQTEEKDWDGDRLGYASDSPRDTISDKLNADQQQENVVAESIDVGVVERLIENLETDKGLEEPVVPLQESCVDDELEVVSESEEQSEPVKEEEKIVLKKAHRVVVDSSDSESRSSSVSSSLIEKIIDSCGSDSEDDPLPDASNVVLVKRVDSQETPPKLSESSQKAPEPVGSTGKKLIGVPTDIKFDEDDFFNESDVKPADSLYSKVKATRQDSIEEEVEIPEHFDETKDVESQLQNEPIPEPILSATATDSDSIVEVKEKEVDKKVIQPEMTTQHEAEEEIIVPEVQLRKVSNQIEVDEIKPKEEEVTSSMVTAEHSQQVSTPVSKVVDVAIETVKAAEEVPEKAPEKATEIKDVQVREQTESSEAHVKGQSSYEVKSLRQKMRMESKLREEKKDVEQVSVVKRDDPVVMRTASEIDSLRPSGRKSNERQSLIDIKAQNPHTILAMRANPVSRKSTATNNTSNARHSAKPTVGDSQTVTAPVVSETKTELSQKRKSENTKPETFFIIKSSAQPTVQKDLVEMREKTSKTRSNRPQSMPALKTMEAVPIDIDSSPKKEIKKSVDVPMRREKVSEVNSIIIKKDKEQKEELKKVYETASLTHTESTLDETPVDDKKEVSEDDRHRVSFWGPKPWNARGKSEPNIDVKTALDIARHFESGSSHGLNNDQQSTSQQPNSSDKTRASSAPVAGLPEQGSEAVTVAKEIKPPARSSSPTKKTLHEQYEDMEAKLTQWQEQLAKNQAVINRRVQSGQKSETASVDPARNDDQPRSLASQVSVDDLSTGRSALRTKTSEPTSIRFGAGGEKSILKKSQSVDVGYKRREGSPPRDSAPPAASSQPQKSLKNGRARSLIQPAPPLDPREELMISIRNAKGISNLRKVEAIKED